MMGLFYNSLMKILINNLHSKIITDNADLLGALYKLYSEKSPGYQYSAAYRRRQWDGEVHFISKNGSFRTGLLKKVIKDLEKIKCEPELEYTEEVSSIEPKNWDLKGFTYYDYQKDLIERGLEEYERSIIQNFLCNSTY